MVKLFIVELHNLSHHNNHTPYPNNLSSSPNLNLLMTYKEPFKTYDELDHDALHLVMPLFYSR